MGLWFPRWEARTVAPPSTSATGSESKWSGQFVTLGLLVLTLLSFAGNSLLNRAALADGQIDWASFTIIRMIAGALLLALLFGIRHGAAILPKRGDSVGALSLFAYAAAFSAAYVHLDAGIGALILFPAGQISMQLIGLLRGVVPSRGQIVGAAIALAGLIYLMAPGTSAPPLWSALLMTAAGIAWGFYSWTGKLTDDAELATARNFLGAGVLALLLLPLIKPDMVSGQGVMLAVVSGAITSALGYILWYRVLSRISITSAAVSQLSVPAIAAAGGILLLGEVLTARLVVGAAIIFAGIGMVIWASGKDRKQD